MMKKIPLTKEERRKNRRKTLNVLKMFRVPLFLIFSSVVMTHIAPVWTAFLSIALGFVIGEIIAAKNDTQFILTKSQEEK